MGRMNIESALRASRCGSSELGAVSDARSGEARERVPLAQVMFYLRNNKAAGGAHPNKSLKPQTSANAPVIRMTSDDVMRLSFFS